MKRWGRTVTYSKDEAVPSNLNKQEFALKMGKR